jgi:D-glutamate cyclase
VDGPIGACVLALSLESLGVAADVVVPAEMVPVVEAVKTSLSANFEIREQARSADEYAAVITIEKLGRNLAGTTHTVLGSPIDQDFAADDLVDQFNREGRLTIAIGDGGNEIGFGAIYDQALELVPRGRDCGCPCGGGIVSTTATQILFPAAVSNHGAYAVSGALAVLAGRPEIAPYSDAIGAAIDVAVRQGCLDGGTFLPHVMADDGIPLESVKAIATVMRTIVEQTFRSTPRSE